MLLRGEQPEWVPHFQFGADPSGRPTAVRSISPSVLMQHLRTPGVAKDIWGVTNVPVPDSPGSKIPEPGNFILKDIRQWRDVVKKPDFSHIDWEVLAKNDIDNAKVNREETLTAYGLFVGFFQQLVALMGFTEALCAMYEEPEEVKALTEFICDFYVEAAEKSIDFYKPDIYDITDDTAAWKSPFFSPEMYREIFKPSVIRQAKIGLDRGLPIQMHNCGRCEDFIDDWLDFGVVSWNPAQVSNDLQAVKEKYGNKLVINGGWDLVGVLANPDVSEEVVKASVRASIDAYAPGGGYAFCGGFLGDTNDPDVIRKNSWIAEEVREYGRVFYKK